MAKNISYKIFTTGMRVLSFSWQSCIENFQGYFHSTVCNSDICTPLPFEPSSRYITDRVEVLFSTSILEQKSLRYVRTIPRKLKSIINIWYNTYQYRTVPSRRFPQLTIDRGLRTYRGCSVRYHTLFHINCFI
jgi:hypothetical protein